jgi:hypothetical protein
VKREELTEAQARRVLGGTVRAPLEVLPTRELVTFGLELALESGCTVYDGCNLGLAISRGCQLVSADERLEGLLPARYPRGGGTPGRLRPPLRQRRRKVGRFLDELAEDAMPKIKLIHHINVPISNRERTREWYEKVLGAEFLDRGPERSPGRKCRGASTWV